MAKDKMTDVLRKHLIVSAQMKKVKIDENDPYSYCDIMSKETALGSLCLLNNKRLEAISLFVEAHIKHPEDFWATNYIGSMALEINDPAVANLYLRDCLEEAPENWSGRPFTLINYACVQLKLGDFKGGLKSLDEVIEKAPTLDRSYYMKAVHQAHSGNYQKALLVIGEGLKKVPESVDLKRMEFDLLDILRDTKK